mmetsp:Transcript_46190/g.128793  ORF Transcript_46190/g.128793 Transcript_46190/m.128793 type:complete len:183 (-) Transcript_46190:136-684(-)|eukprot:CAMPEP_0119468276 /NCGR_PEP_ID=MMETSP1344-20130328/2095_1 /TAXON_ID=236787 /ORGANISM="Florenciella parvula, Strain CCMP2471" /LENGTH=182 /DNA_ID=CAMNT_0007500725 /DNA_START=74 /DNA_END=622 /DNA_ORIENTATION=+
MRLTFLLLASVAAVSAFTPLGTRRPLVRKSSHWRLQSEPVEVAESVTVEATDSAVAAPVEVAESGIDESELSPKELEILRLKQAEKFVVKETGVYECKVCGYGYEESEQGTAFTDLPNSWRCPQCLSQKGVFYAKTETIAGFAENQQYGFGTNEMTADQKNGLIFGGIGAFFLLFLSGYLLE